MSPDTVNESEFVTELLISIRDEQEAAILGTWKAGIVDFKHPGRGALGALDRTAVHKMLAVLTKPCLKSLALGELTDWIEFGQRTATQPEQNRSELDRIVPESDEDLLREFQFVKVGLADLMQVAHWQDHWLQFMQSVPSSVRPVGVCYVDGQTAGCPPIEAVIELVSQIGKGALLLDTIDKSAGRLVSHLSPRRIARIVDRCHQLGLPVALAGSVQTADLPALLDGRPDFIGVRGAVCTTGRSQLEPARLIEFTTAFHRARSHLPQAISESGNRIG